MTLVYVKLIIWKRMNYSNVPERYRAGVRKGLAERGYNTSGNKL